MDTSICIRQGLQRLPQMINIWVDTPLSEEELRKYYPKFIDFLGDICFKLFYKLGMELIQIDFDYFVLNLFCYAHINN